MMTPAKSRRPKILWSRMAPPGTAMEPSLQSKESDSETARVSRAAAAVTILKVEPGSMVCWTAGLKAASGVLE